MTMSGKDRDRLHEIIDRRLAGIVQASPVPPTWQAAWARLEPNSTQQERLHVCQSIRASNMVPEDAGYFLVCWQAENMAQEAQSNFVDRLADLNLFEAGEASKRIFVELLERHGEKRMAESFRSDPAGHVGRRELGRQFFFDQESLDVPEDPTWLNGLLQIVANSIVASEQVQSLAYRYCQEGEFWDVHVACPNGGDSAWAVDLEGLREAFADIDTAGWYAFPASKEAIPYAWIEGRSQGRDLFLRVLGYGPNANRLKDGYAVWNRS